MPRDDVRDQRSTSATTTASHRDGATKPVDPWAAASKAINVLRMSWCLDECERTGESLTDGNIQAGE